MQYNVSQLLREATGASRTYAFDQRLAPREGEQPSHARGTALLIRTNRGILAFVRAHVAGAGRCCRCLRKIAVHIEVGFEEEFLPTIDATTGSPLEFDEGEGAFRIDEQHTLDLMEALRQYRLTAEPMAPLCREDCRGFCAECGTDLNEGACACSVAVDRRWKALEALANDQQERKR